MALAGDCLRVTGGLSTITHSQPNLIPNGQPSPWALNRHEGRTTLLLTNPGGEPLDLVLQRGQLLDLTCVLHIAIGLATAPAKSTSVALWL